MRLGNMLGHLKNVFGHLKNVFIHKWWVFYYACKLRIPWQGLIHDLSKFSWVELKESIKYYQGNKSPIPVAKAEQGYSEAWQHHKGHNKHHYEYWIDNIDGEIKLIPIPFKYILEIIADWLGAYRVYNGKEDFNAEYEWWLSKKDKLILIHPISKKMIGVILHYIAIYQGVDNINFDKIFKNNYKSMIDQYNNEIVDVNI